MCICVLKQFALGFRLSQLKEISLQLISKHLSFHQQPYQTPEHLLLRVPPPPHAVTTYLCVCVGVYVYTCACLFKSLSSPLTRQAVREKVTPSPQKSISLVHTPLSFCHSLALSISLLLDLTEYHSPLAALVFHCCLCLLSHFSTHLPLFNLCHAVFDLLCVSHSPPSVSIFNLSLSPTSHLWLCKMKGEEKGRQLCWLGDEGEATKEENRGGCSTGRCRKVVEG